MKKLFIIVLCLGLLMSVVGCSKGIDEPVTNPIKEYKSLDEINEITGGNLMKPAIMGVEDKTYLIIQAPNDVAEYDFTLNGTPFRFRYSKAPFDEDISGYYIGGEPAFTAEDYGICFVNPAKDVRLARWQDTQDGQYVLMAEGEIDQNSFMDLVYELSDIIGVKEVDYNDIPETNFRMEIEEDGDNIILYSYPLENLGDNTTISKVTYYCEGEKVVKVVMESIFEDEELAKMTYNEIKDIYDEGELELNGNTISMVIDENGESYKEMTRSELLENLYSSMELTNN